MTGRSTQINIHEQTSVGDRTNSGLKIYKNIDHAIN